MAITENRLDSAYTNLVEAGASAIEPDLRLRVQEVANTFEEKANALLAAADADFAARNYEAALTSYRLVSRWTKLGVATKAKQCLMTAEANPELKSYFREMRASDLFKPVAALLAEKAPSDATATTQPAEKPLAEQLRTLRRADNSDLLAVMRALDGLKAFADTPTGAKAEALRQAISADKDLSTTITRLKADDEARSEYQMAVQYRNNQLNDKAAAGFRAVVSKYPGTTWASKAAEDLKKLPQTASR